MRNQRRIYLLLAAHTLLVLALALAHRFTESKSTESTIGLVCVVAISVVLNVLVRECAKPAGQPKIRVREDAGRFEP